ncbi:MAG: triose-phosphate isomerase [Candidatus Taylorbacteria bacterium RIFCSPHIGHO2_02_FULL_45_28]|uniref:Triosephosphate isomerase n=1 Tax=Candidatus Taylorbacteria bacterium RIFCSPHIGHO2_12_FULL_45_16 TaxID=1802315 RepID=A0A1G2N0S3_9BACT|nr:MAG: triose-phosphate isomerase [Candidatus Taylorbacteria bacterium RIFCSPHIGHO2_01_FULL_44_110]OHA24977.1 MAG: triose-phosphate isomerase [Candidatus Taylorbacteria bacterium RIFCSPHIGHO2_02_FULL_45_28]OHA29795.1 MAG: triose-phosphate isomerase [Candidatus Taylorbacteria bacterium RIFCSPHIGHO2_12_FULL_45_16]OHA32739.1 MAG: triose-phosphate isomerase [Candidatus Taylorbacteria bacterium RIFCSPLOWO2_01_FULL_45_59]OHA39033.1 MAG: triose-phosphate isomerase [Candidatus Taylorbacteria bacterium
MSKKLVIGNWKMNPATLDDAKNIIRKIRRTANLLKNTVVVVCPPFVYTQSAISRRGPSTLKVGAQTVSYEKENSHTGEISAKTLVDIGVEYVIAGHSEERARNDTDEIVSRRVKAIIEAGMNAVVCVGERVRDDGGGYLETLKSQIKNSLADVPSSLAKNIIIAYEPVWAIGAKEAMMPEQIYEMSLFVKKVFSDIFSQNQAMKTLVIYGGSVNFRNAREIITVGKVDGLLVGRESVNTPGFVELLKAVDDI